jgi:Cu+-exporting ATPase
VRSEDINLEDMSSLAHFRIPSFPPQDLVHSAPDQLGMITTIFISNLHCSRCVKSRHLLSSCVLSGPSCVATVEEALSSLRPPPYSVQTSIVSQAITIQHPPELPYSYIKAHIEDAGFDVATQPIPSGSRPPFYRSLTGNARAQRHLMHCSLCQQELRTDVGSGYPTDANISPCHDMDTENRPFAISALAIYTITLSVGGMTCASCSGGITNALNDLPFVRDCSVSLLSNSATVTVDGGNHESKVVEAIEDLGYEVSIVDSKRAHDLSVCPDESGATDIDGPYIMSLSIGGMTCTACSLTITRLVTELDGVLDVNISLLGNSGVVQVDRKERAQDIVGAIQDAGYNASLLRVEPVQASPHSGAAKMRTVSLQVDGMFCR